MQSTVADELYKNFTRNATRNAAFGIESVMERYKGDEGRSVSLL